jgi:hypothetical protein
VCSPDWACRPGGCVAVPVDRSGRGMHAPHASPGAQLWTFYYASQGDKAFGRIAATLSEEGQMGPELLFTVVKGARAARTVHTLFSDQERIEQVATALGEVNQKAAHRLVREAVALPPREQVATLHQVTLLLEQASEAGPPKSRFIETPGKYVGRVRMYCVGLMWLAIFYQSLGQPE